MIKRITLKCGSFSYKCFIKYIAENGNAVCAINDEIVEPEAGNEIFRKLKAKGAYVSDREVIDMDNEEIVRYIESGIDHYVEYIDDYRRYEQVRSQNDRLHKLILEFGRIAK